MNETNFLRAIQASPGEAGPRLIFADWLEERGDSRGEFLRLACAADGSESPNRFDAKASQRLDTLARALDPDWIARVMRGRVWFRYHCLTFALLNEKPELSPANLEKIERWEKQHQRMLPASLREWYSLKGAERRLRVDTEGFVPFRLPVALARAPGIPRDERRRLSPAFPLGKWSINGSTSLAWFDGTEDPPLFAPQDPQRDEGPGDEQMQSFSGFAFCRVWSRLTQACDWYAPRLWIWDFRGTDQYDSDADGREEVDPDFPLLQAKEAAFGPRDLQYLATRYTEGLHQLVVGKPEKPVLNPFTGAMVQPNTPTSVLRFFGLGVRVKVISRENPQKQKTEAYWSVSADSQPALLQTVAENLWTRGTLSRTFESPTRAGQAVLATLRRVRR